MELTGTCVGCEAVVELSAEGHHGNAVDLPRLQGAETQLVLVLLDGPGLQAARPLLERDQEAVHVPAPGRPAGPQTAALTTVTHMDVLHLAGDWRGTRIKSPQYWFTSLLFRML